LEINEQSKEIFKQFMNDGKIQVTLFPENTVRNFKSLKSFYEFLIKEKKYWEPFQSSRLGEIRSHFINIVTSLESAFRAHDENQSRTYFNNVIRDINLQRFPNVFSTTSIGQFLSDRYRITHLQADAACMYLFDRTFGASSRDGFDGFVHSFLLAQKNEVASTIILNERDSLERLHLNYSEELDKLQHDYLEKSIKVDSDYKDFQEQLTKWKDELQQSFSNQLNEKFTALENLERLYHEKLRLESPAVYWEKLATSYEEQGTRWRKWVLITSGVFILFLSLLLYIEPSSYFVVDKALNFNSIKSAVIFLLISTIFVYIISLFVRLSTSAFHLSRDAKERFQLTHVYLSLLNEKGIQESERAIVLQSIFSRADTGLLKGDSAPVFPDSTVSQLFKGISGK